MSTVEKPKGEPFDNGPLMSNGQYRDYAVLPQSERDKGFVRPIRETYQHVGPPGPHHELRDLTVEEHLRYDKFGYIKYEAYPPDGGGVVGRFWTQPMMDAVLRGGCGTVTTMGRALAETYARDPSYYGATFCAGCRKHLPVGADGEFIWAGTEERVGT